MDTPLPRSGLQLRSLVKADGELRLSLDRVEVGAPASAEVVVRVEAAPINPSDLGLLLAGAEMEAARWSGPADNPVVTASIPQAALPGLKGRLDQAMPVGNEGAGVVVAAGEAEQAQALVGKTVAMIGGAMYAQYRTISATDCLVLPADATAADGASAFVNPLTALGMVETMRREGHRALVHTAAASNLGQMLNRVCLKDGIGLVNIVRTEEQARILRDLGAVHVCNSRAPGFMAELTEALAATGATLAFDAIGGGPLAGQILMGMEAAIARTPSPYSRYGSTVHKQVYIYGGLDTGPTEITRSFGMTWGVGGWLLFPFLTKVGPVAVQTLRARVAAELQTTFASHYTREISLVDVLKPDIMAAYSKRSTGGKYLINPSKDLPGV